MGSCLRASLSRWTASSPARSTAPGCGLGVGGERSHRWVDGGPWTHDSPGAESRLVRARHGSSRGSVRTVPRSPAEAPPRALRTG